MSRILLSNEWTNEWIGIEEPNWYTKQESTLPVHWQWSGVTNCPLSLNQPKKKTGVSAVLVSQGAKQKKKERKKKTVSPHQDIQGILQQTPSSQFQQNRLRKEVRLEAREVKEVHYLMMKKGWWYWMGWRTNERQTKKFSLKGLEVKKTQGNRNKIETTVMNNRWIGLKRLT